LCSLCRVLSSASEVSLLSRPTLGIHTSWLAGWPAGFYVVLNVGKNRDLQSPRGKINKEVCQDRDLRRATRPFIGTHMNVGSSVVDRINTPERGSSDCTK
jgi:hypothetical protein